ncbi:hypothetical protein V5F29_12135 [Xanthobacter aminoxidans]|uniref:PD-(D/E)XK nuclease domain-containing protein n=1 Tax=Xanthobacter aminoxidans TaxID=186280 RepID=UPI003728080A
MNRDKAIQIIERQKAFISELRSSSRTDQNFIKWKRDTEVALEKIFGEKSRNVSEFSDISFSPSAFSIPIEEKQIRNAYNKGMQKSEAILSSILDEIINYGTGTDSYETEVDAISTIERICLKFHAVARQLRARHSNRQTLAIEDEYDVQDLMHALLKINFDDIRPEEWTPSNSGGSARVDFLLKREKIVIEIKKTRTSLKPSEIGAQLLVDIARYRQHPDCELLFCFIYDPEGIIGNPIGFERDLENSGSDLKVRTIVGPKG